MIGIDLGTTFCAVAHLDDRGRPQTLPNRDGDILTPSAVYLTADNQAVVGQPALDVGLEQPENVATLIKRRMGYPEFGRPVAGRDFRPEVLSAIILRKLVQDAELHLGPVTQAVITVPAYFDDTRRKATMDAGAIAGLDVLDIIDEPSAAALAYTVSHGGDIPADAPKTVLVYDLGGGTFDVTLMKLSKKKFQVVAIEGDAQLGGKDWDDRLVAHAAGHFQEKFAADPRSDPQSLAMLRASAERAKRTLSKVEAASITVSHGGHKLTVPLTRADFEGLTQDLLTRTRMTALAVLRQAKLTWDRVDKVLMVGGSTHMPMTGRMLAELTGKPPDRTLAVSEVVARGAALHAGIKQQASGGRKPAVSSNFDDIVEITVNAHSLGVEIRKGDDRLNDKLIPKNTQLPAAESRTYFTAVENQQRVRVRILQGDAPKAAACIPVGECWIDGLPEKLAKGSPVRVTCGVAANGRIEVTAAEATSGKRARAEIHRAGGMTAEEIAAAAAWVRGLTIQ